MANSVGEKLRAEVALRAGRRCEYCLIREEDAGFRHQIDHILSRKHGGTTNLENLAYACVFCNRSKGADVAAIDPRTGEVVRLFHPRQDRWAEHFRLALELFEPLSAVGRATIRLLRMNAAERVAERVVVGWRQPLL